VLGALQSHGIWHPLGVPTSVWAHSGVSKSNCTLFSGRTYEANRGVSLARARACFWVVNVHVSGSASMQHSAGYKRFLIPGSLSFLGCEYCEQWLSALLNSTPFSWC
jgi:hypothetical protein